MAELDLVLVMGSIHRVLKAEKILRGAQVQADTMITPREVSADCGMVVTIRQADASRALELLGEADVAPAEVWKLESGSYRMLEGAPRR